MGPHILLPPSTPSRTSSVARPPPSPLGPLLHCALVLGHPFLHLPPPPSLKFSQVLSPCPSEAPGPPASLFREDHCPPVGYLCVQLFCSSSPSPRPLTECCVPDSGLSMSHTLSHFIQTIATGVGSSTAMGLEPRSARLLNLGFTPQIQNGPA